MLPLDSPRWAELDHAYGRAADIPQLLIRLRAEGDEGEAWDAIWSALAHQSDVHSASFAAVPHVVDILAAEPLRKNSAFLQFPAWVEICRNKTGVEIPDDLAPAYFEALDRLPTIAAAALRPARDEEYIRCALFAIAAASRQPALAEAILELSPDVVTDFWDWFYAR